MEGSNRILNSVSADNVFVDNKYTHQFDGTDEYGGQFVIQGSVDISITERNEEGDVSGSYSFKNVTVNDSLGDVSYNVSGTGSFSTVRIENEDSPEFSITTFDAFTLDSYSVSGIGKISVDDLEVINIVFASFVENMRSQLG